MKYLILIVLILMGCQYNQKIVFDIFTNNDRIFGKIIIKNDSGLIEIDTLPFTIHAKDGELLTAIYNFYINQTELNLGLLPCNCKHIEKNEFECIESFEVTGEDWEIAK